MGGNIPPEVFEEYIERQRLEDARKRRMTARTVLAEMVRQEAAENGLTWRRRRALVRFAGKFGIEPYEAQLLIRAAQFSHADPKAASNAQLAQEYLAEIGGPAASAMRLWVIVGALFINTVALIWLLKR